MANTTQTPKVACWLCGTVVQVRFSKKDKPYLVCDCGIQVFVRYKKAERLLAEKVKLEMTDHE